MTTAQEYQKHCDALELVTKLQESLEAYFALDQNIIKIMADEWTEVKAFKELIERQGRYHVIKSVNCGNKAIEESKKK